jgi:hypothetical protein
MLHAPGDEEDRLSVDPASTQNTAVTGATVGSAPSACSTAHLIHEDAMRFPDVQCPLGLPREYEAHRLTITDNGVADVGSQHRPKLVGTTCGTSR